MRTNALFIVSFVVIFRQIRGHLDLKIVGGEKAEDGEFPWIVQLEIGDSNCTGSLVRPDVVVTAAHCLINNECKLIDTNIRVLGQVPKNVKLVDNVCVKVKVHPEFVYVGGVAKNDIALILLQKNFKTKIPYLADMKLGQSGRVASWVENGSRSNEIFKVNLTTYGCKKPELGQQVCAGHPNNGTCASDVGSPFICNSNDTICGFFSHPDDDTTYSGVYTNIGRYHSWINQTIANFEDNKCTIHCVEKKTEACYSEISSVASHRITLSVFIVFAVLCLLWGYHD